MFEEELAPILHNPFLKIEEEKTFLYLFYKTTITLVPKPDKDSTKTETNNPHEYECKKKKILNTILANGIQHDTKRILYHEWALFQGCKTSSIFKK